MSDVRQTDDYLILLLKSAITGEKLPTDIDFDTRFDDIMRIASSHELAHLAAMPLLKNNAIKDDNHCNIAKKHMFDASYRDTKNRYTYELAEKILTNAGIAYIPLKGSVIKNYYPEQWMRTSCDIDILVRKSDFDRAVEAFKQNDFTLCGDLNFHDVSLLYDDTNLELHYSICENMKSIDSVLRNVWDYTEQTDGCKYTEKNDFFTFHHIAHMSYHFLAGGCGIRPFLDFWILKNAAFFNPSAVESLCRQAKIGDFYTAVMSLTDAWFEKGEHTDISLKMKKYILTGGAYGYYPNNAAAYTVRNGGKINYILSLALPPYSNMRVMYPVINRVPALLPFCYIFRLFQKTLGKNSGNAKKKYNIIKRQDKEFIKEVAGLIAALKLDK